MNKAPRCNRCGQCCRGEMGPFVFPSDVPQLCTALGVTPSALLESYCERYDMELPDRQIPLYALKTTQGHCVFLNEHNLCNIYPSRPYQCVHAPLELFSDYRYWAHMPCMEESLFRGRDSSPQDEEMLRQLIYPGYNQYFKKEGEEPCQVP